MTTDVAHRTAVEVTHLCDFSIDFEDIQIMPAGGLTRVVYVVKNGTVEGKRINGEIVAGGGDWILLGSDQIARLDVRATLRTDDGELVYITNTGRVDLRDGVLDRFSGGEPLTSADVYARSSPLFETGSEKYAWMNSIVTVAFNGFAPAHVDYEIYEVR